MAGSVRLLIPLGICLASATFAQQRDDAGTGGPPPRRPELPGGPNGPVANSPEFQEVRKALEALTPAQRRRFQENIWRWVNLPPAEKRALRDRDELRRAVVNQEVDAALKEAGLTLEGDRRDAFEKRYAEERRKIEEQLRREMNEKRRPLVHDVVARLKAEFSAPAAATPAPSLASPAPAKPQP